MGLALRGGHRGRPRRPPRRRGRRLRRHHRGHPAAHARRAGRGADPRLQGRRRRAGRDLRRPARRAEPQPRDRAPASSGRCGRRPATPAAWRCWPGPRRPGSTTKSGLIVGMGETDDEVVADAGRPAPASASTSSPSASTCGPPPHHLPVARWVEPGEFDRLRRRRRGPRHRPRRGQPAHPLELPRPPGGGRGRRLPPAARALAGTDAVDGHPWSRCDDRGVTPRRRSDGPGRAWPSSGVDVLLLSVGPGPALPDRLRGHAARAADDAGPAPRGRRHARRAPAGGAAGGRAARRVRAAALGRDRRPGRPRRRPGGRGRAAWRSATARGPGSWSTSRPRCPAPAFVRGSDGHRAAAGGQGRGRGRRPAPGGRGRRPGRRRAPGGRDPARRAHRGRGVGRPGAAASSPRATSRSTSPSSPPAPTPPAPTTRPGDRVIGPGEVVLCDFGGTMLDADGVGYCSDITRCVHVGEPPAEVAEAYAVLHEAQRAAVAAAVVGTPCEDVDAAARRVIADGGLRRPLHPPHRPRHRHRGARGPVHRRRQRDAAGRRPRLLGRAGHLRAGALRPAARGHRRRHRRRPRRAQPGRPRPGRRRRLRRPVPRGCNLASAPGLFEPCMRQGSEA